MFRRVVPVTGSESTDAGLPVRALLYGHQAWGSSDGESRENVRALRPAHSQLAVFHATDAAKMVYGQQTKDAAQKPKLMRPKSSATLRSGSTQRGSLSGRRVEKELAAQHEFAQGLLTSLSQNMLASPITSVDPKHKRGQSMVHVKVEGACPSDPPSVSASTSQSVSPTAPVARQGKPSVALVPDTSFDASIGRGPSSVLDQDSTRESSPHRPTVASPKSTERPVRRQRGSKQAHSPVHTGNSLDIVMSQLDDEPHLPSPPRNTTVIGFLSDSMKIPSPMREEAVTVPLRVFVEGFSRHITTFTLPAAHTLADARKSFASSKYLPNHYAFLKSKDGEVVPHDLEPQLSVLLFAPDIVLRPLAKPVLTSEVANVAVDVQSAVTAVVEPQLELDPPPSDPEGVGTATLAELAGEEGEGDDGVEQEPRVEPGVPVGSVEAEPIRDSVSPAPQLASHAVVAVVTQPPIGALFRFDGTAFVPVMDPAVSMSAEPSPVFTVPPVALESESLLFKTPSIEDGVVGSDLPSAASQQQTTPLLVLDSVVRVSPVKAASPAGCLEVTYPFGVDIDGENDRPMFNYRRASIRGSGSVHIQPERPQRQLRYSLSAGVSDIALFDHAPHKTFTHLVVDVGVDSVSVQQERNLPDFVITPVVAPDISFDASPAKGTGRAVDTAAIVTSPVHPLFAKHAPVMTPVDDGATDAGNATLDTTTFHETPSSALFGANQSITGLEQGSVEAPQPVAIHEIGESEEEGGDDDPSDYEEMTTYHGSSVAGDSVTGQQNWTDPAAYENAQDYSGYPEYHDGYGGSSGYGYSGQPSGYGYDYSGGGYGYGAHMAAMGYQQYVPVPVPVPVPMPTPVQMMSPYASMYDMRSLSAMGSHPNLLQAQMSPSQSGRAPLNPREAPAVSPMSSVSSLKYPLDTRASVASSEGGDFVVRAPGRDNSKLFAGLQITPLSDELRSMAFGEEKQ